MRVSRLLVAIALASAAAACTKSGTKSAADTATTPSRTASVPIGMPATAVPNGPLPSLAPMLAKISPAVVNVSVQGTQTTQPNALTQDPLFRRFFNMPDQPQKQRFQAVGSGVIYDAAQGFVITNSHVVSNADNIMVTLSDRRTIKAKLVGNDPQTDIAVLKIPAEHLSSVPLGDSHNLRVGDYVVAIGNPFGLGQTATFGIVSATGRTSLGIEGPQGYEDFIQTDASINPGNSGGALLDLNGNLVGINTAILSESGGNVGIGFAIPVDMVKGVVTQLIKSGKVTRGQLGVIIQDLTPEIAQAIGNNLQEGALVSQVQPGSGAGQAGVKVGDVITAVNGTNVMSAAALRNIIGAMEPGTTVHLSLQRKGQKLDVAVTLKPQTQQTAAGGPSDQSTSNVDGLELGTIPQSDPAFGSMKGAYVMSVEPGSTAESSGLQQGDIIVSADQNPISGADDLTKLLKQKRDKPLLLQIQRGTASLFVALQ